MLSRKSQKGFTLLEMMISVALIGILVTAAVFYYQGHIRKSRRQEALQTLLSIQLAEEQYRAHNIQYGTLSQIWSGTTTQGGYYTLSVPTVGPTQYTLTATAQNDQTNDTAEGVSCSVLTLSVSNGVETKTPAACWRG